MTADTRTCKHCGRTYELTKEYTWETICPACNHGLHWTIGQCPKCAANQAAEQPAQTIDGSKLRQMAIFEQ